MRWRVVVPLLLAIVVVGGAVIVGGVLVLANRTSSPAHAGITGSPVPLRPAVLVPLRPAGPPPTRAAVRAAIAPGLNELPTGEQISGLVVDSATGTTLWRRQPATPVAPASTLKLLTAAAALRTLGPGFRFTTSTRVLGNTAYLVGGGDPTLVESDSADDSPAAYPKPATLTDLAAETAKQLQPGHPVKLRADVSEYSGPALAVGWSDDYVTEGDVTPPSPLELDGGRLRPGDFDSPRTSDPARQAVDAFAALLRKDGVKVVGAVSMRAAPARSSLAATVSSPPLAALVQRMLTDSDNDLAEALGRAVALHDNLPPTFVGAAAAVKAEAGALGAKLSELTLHDTSGLSHLDEVAPAVLVTVLRAAVSDTGSVLRPILEGLPVAAFTGTLAKRYRGKHEAAGAGYVRAKTGSLTGVNALAGVVADASGRLLVFALLGSGTTDTDSVQAALDDMASALSQVS